MYFVKLHNLNGLQFKLIPLHRNNVQNHTRNPSLYRGIITGISKTILCRNIIDDFYREIRLFVFFFFFADYINRAFKFIKMCAPIRVNLTGLLRTKIRRRPEERRYRVIYPRAVIDQRQDQRTFLKGSPRTAMYPDI